MRPTRPSAQIFTDGRALPTDLQLTWLGYSLGKWVGVFGHAKNAIGIEEIEARVAALEQAAELSQSGTRG